jgi:protein-S-isoprenylcysteine O-methyltransferase Ste14
VPILVAVFILHYLIAALDVGRFHLSDSVPFAWQCVGTALTYAGLEGLIWTMVVNRFFSSAIRLQEDRGQHVIDSGPYHYVRHPGYAFATVAFLAEGMMLGSWLSIVPILVMMADFAYRALMEERLLKAELPGYAEYCQKVRFRLCPGIW